MPGRAAGYHVASTWFMLGEVVRRVDGRPFERYVREALFLPLGMDDSWCGLPPDRYAAYGDRVGIMVNTDPQFRPRHQWDTPEMAALCKPGGNGRGPARDLVRFYQMLLGGGALDGVRVALAADGRGADGPGPGGDVRPVVQARHGLVPGAGAEQRPVRGRHGAVRVRPARRLADGRARRAPVVGRLRRLRHGVAAAVIFNGTPGEAAHDRRVRAVLAAVYEDLGLATGGSSRTEPN